MEYLSSFRLTSKILFPAPLCPYSNIVICVTMEPHTSSYLSKCLVTLFSITSTTAYRLHTLRRADYTRRPRDDYSLSFDSSMRYARVLFK